MKIIRRMTLKEAEGILHEDLEGLTEFIIEIREPAEPLIVKSGETWVAHWEGVDYLMTDKWGCPPSFNPDHVDIETTWKSFTGPNPDIVELTDDIAKLRPMVKVDKVNHACGRGGVYTLYGINTCGSAILEDERENTGKADACHLATAKELQAQK